MVKKMLKKTQNKSVSIAFIADFFTLVLLANFLKIHVSSIYLIIIAGLLGLAFIPCREGKEIKHDLSFSVLGSFYE